MNKQKKILVKQCVICGKEFKTRRENQLCCSQECMRQKRLERAREYERLHRKRAELLRKKCQWCGKTFETRLSFQKYCGYECASVAHAKNQAEYQAAKKSTQKKSAVEKTVQRRDWVAEAMSVGMSYGKYRAAVELLGKTHEELLANMRLGE